MALNTLPSESDGREKEDQEEEAEIRRDLRRKSSSRASSIYGIASLEHSPLPCFGARCTMGPRSVLCLGQPTDPIYRAVLVKHFETPICPQHFEPSDNVSARGDISWGSIKGGFLLPPEIRDAKIICEGDESTAIPEDAQTWDDEFV